MVVSQKKSGGISSSASAARHSVSDAFASSSSASSRSSSWSRRVLLEPVSFERGQLKLELRAPLHQLRAERAPQARQQGAERGRWIARAAVRPEGVDEFVARGRPVAVQDEVRQQGAPDAPGKPVLEASPAHLEPQLTTEVDAYR
jgi:hypothetical protein